MRYHFLFGLVVAASAFGSASAGDDSHLHRMEAVIQTDAISWANADAAALEPMVGQEFNARLADGRTVLLTLSRVIEDEPDADRPSFLPRRNAVVNVFTLSEADAVWLMQSGGQTAQVWHPDLGSDLLYLAVYPEADGSHTAEIILN